MSKPANKLAEQLLTETREELVRADAKAATLFGIVGVVLGVFAAAIIAGDWSPGNLSNCIEWLWWLGAALVVVSLALLGTAIYPKVTSIHAGGPITYWRDVVAYGKDHDALVKALDEQVEEGDRTTTQLMAISEIVGRKYLFVRLALAALGIGVVCSLAAILIS